MEIWVSQFIRQWLVTFVQKCRIYFKEVLVNEINEIINSDQVHRSYDDLYLCITSLGTQRIVSFPLHSSQSNYISYSSQEFITVRLPWQPAGIKFTHCVSGHKSALLPQQEKPCVGSKNGWHLSELSRRSLSACKVWGRSNYARRV